MMKATTVDVRTGGGRLFRGSGLGNEGRIYRLKRIAHNRQVAPRAPVVKPSIQDTDTDHGQGIMDKWR